MSLSNCDTTMQVVPAGYGNSGGMGWGGDWSAWIILFLIFGAFGGWGGYGGFGGNRGASGGMDGYVLTTDFANIERKIDGVNSGLCDGFYAMNTGMLNGFAGVNTNISNGFANLNTNLCQLGNSVAQGQNALQAQLASCCCDIKGGIKDNTTQSIMNTNAIQQQIAQCCCNVEKDTMQTRFDMAQNTCSTLQAIDKMGDRIIDYLAAEKTQALRDENQALRLAASQVAQNQYLVSQLRPPLPVPAYTVANPFTPVTGATA